MNAIADSVRDLRRKVELGDVLLFIYLLTFMRQCYWGVGNNLLAWVLSFLSALSFWCFGMISKKEPSPDERVSKSFYLIVALPLFGIYLMRFVFPDTSFDVLNYHIVAAERSLRGFPFRPGDFFPIDLPVNPIPDMVTGIYRHILGYRVGTIVNYLTLIWIATILVKFVRVYIKKAWLVYLVVLLILLTETLLFEINNYMVDLLALPLLLQATYLVLYTKEHKTLGLIQFYIAFLLGLSVAFKLTNIAFVIPIMLVWAQRMFAGGFKLKPARVVFVSLVFLAPIVPYTIHLYAETGSPVFPFFNGFFKSPYWVYTNFQEPAYGPEGVLQTLTWPFLLYSKPYRISELGVYAGKLPLGFALAFFLLLFKRVDARIRALSFILIVGSLLWSFALEGASRYALFLELLGGIVVVYLSYFIAQTFKIRKSIKQTLSYVPLGVLAALSCMSLYYASRYEWSMRKTIIDTRHAYLRESQFLFGDYSLRSFLPPKKAALFDEVGVWVKFASLVSCFEGLLKPDIPAISLRSFVSFERQEAKDKFAKAIQDARNKRMFSLSYVQDLQATVDFITQRGMGIGKITTISVPYFSYHTVYTLALIEVLPPGPGGSQTRPIIFSPAEGPLPGAAFRADIGSSEFPETLTAGTATTVYVSVKNVSSVVWPGLGRNDGAFKVTLGNHWLDRGGKVLVSDDARASLPFDLKPGDEVELPLTISTPSTPGIYILEIDMVQEQVVWFGTAGSRTLRAYIQVE